MSPAVSAPSSRVVAALVRRSDAAGEDEQTPLGVASPVVGSFSSGTFAGEFRLCRMVLEYGQLSAVGVFSGRLTATRSGLSVWGSRRVTIAAEPVLASRPLRLGLGAVTVNLLGLLVAMEPVEVALPGAVALVLQPAEPAPA